MTDRSKHAALSAGALLLACAAATPVRAQEEERKLGAKDTAEFSWVLTDGNTESSSLGFKNTYEYAWEPALFTLKAGGIRVASQADASIAIEEPDGDIRILEPDKDVTAENYFLNGRYDRDISERLIWFVGAGWERNEFAGFDNRWIGEAGVGHNWHDTEDLVFRTRYSLTYTNEDLVVDDPDRDDSFLGYRFAWDYLNKLAASTTFTNDLILDGNADESSAWRGDMDTGVAVSMTSHLALKVGLRLLYENDPKLEELTLIDLDDVTLGTTLAELEELDTIFTASLVVNF